MAVAILIVDDHETDRYLLTRQIRKTQLVDKIFEVRDGDEALEFFSDNERKRADYPEEYPPLVVFLDVNMPRIGGFEFLEEFAKIRGPNGLESVVVMMFSTSERKEDVERALTFEFVSDYLVKGSYGSDDLAARISALLQRVSPGQVTNARQAANVGASDSCWL